MESCKQIKILGIKNQLSEKIKQRYKGNQMIKVLVFADKTSNIQKLDKDEYKTLTTGSITSTHKKVPNKINTKINRQQATGLWKINEVILLSHVRQND